ncbi:hypothetical protein [Lentilactobacillus senioris]|uniref:hypothetical protein n=1 Tax=Lentilactobacillus senioris TaxID=931534 RepID=UPI003D2D59FA
MNKKSGYQYFGVLVFVILCFAGGYMYLNSDVYTVNQLNIQMNNMISKKDYKQMKSVVNNHDTYLFLRNLSSKDKVYDTSDFQGGSNENAYYVTVVNNKKLDVYMRKAGMASWEIKHVGKQSMS